MALATVTQFEARHGDADEFVEPLLDDASALILDEVTGSEEEWVTEEEPEEVPAKVVAVCIAVAYRAWKNPEALARESLGAHSMEWRQKAEDALYLTDRERRTVKRAAGTGSFTAVTLESPYSGDETGNDLLESDIEL